MRNNLIFIIIFFIFLAGSCFAEETLTWQDCIREAAENNPELIYAEEVIKQSEAGKKIASSGSLPQFTSSLGASTVDKSGQGTDTFSYGVTGTQLLFDGFKASSNIKAADENVRAARHGYRFASAEVRMRLRSSFINLFKAQELLSITEEIYSLRRGNLGLITLRYKSGLEHKGALLNAEANLAQAEFEISQAKRALRVAQRQLVKEMGRESFSPLKIEGYIEVNELELERPDFEALAEDNPYLERVMAQKNAAAFGVKSAQADFLPRISAQSGFGKNDSNWPPKDEQWSTGLSLSLPLFEGGLRLAEASRARALFNQAQANQRSTRDSVILTLEQMWAAFQNAVEAVEVQKKFLSAAEERARISESQYSLGLIKFDNWIIIEDELVRSKKSFLDVQVSALLAEANWIQAKGETLEYAE